MTEAACGREQLLTVDCVGRLLRRSGRGNEGHCEGEGQTAGYGRHENMLPRRGRTRLRPSPPRPSYSSVNTTRVPTSFGMLLNGSPKSAGNSSPTSAPQPVATAMYCLPLTE